MPRKAWHVSIQSQFDMHSNAFNKKASVTLIMLETIMTQVLGQIYPSDSIFVEIISLVPWILTNSDSTVVQVQL